MAVFAPYDVSANPKQNTLLNPENMYDFYYDYQFNQEAIPAKLGITEGQANGLKIYTDWLISINTQTPNATVLAKTIEGGMN